MCEENEIMVSIICCTYNQEKYIGDALESFVMQQTDFPFEVLVHDDASTDGTADVVREYVSRYPQIIRPYYQEENQYSQGRYGGDYLYPMMRGKYIAFCEGDDYWTDSHKLQKQYDAMEAHPECDMCAHAVERVLAESKKRLDVINPLGRDGIITMEDVIVGGGNYLGTNSLFCRREIRDEKTKFEEAFPIDYSFQIHGAMRGGILYLKDIMSAYRRGAENSWTLHMKADNAAMVNHAELMKKMLDMADQETQYQYKDSFDFAKLKYDYMLASFARDASQVYSKKFKSIRAGMSRKQRLITFSQCFAPWLLTLWNLYSHRRK